MFLLGGISGIILRNSSIDKVVHDSYYVVAHFHLVLRIGAVFGVLISVHLWVPLFFGVCFNRRIGKTVFLLLFRRVNLIFIPMHLRGLRGYARKVVDSPSELSALG